MKPQQTPTEARPEVAGNAQPVTAADAWIAYKGTRSGTFHRDGKWIGQAAQAAMEAEAYAAWEAAVLREKLEQPVTAAPVLVPAVRLVAAAHHVAEKRATVVGLLPDGSLVQSECPLSALAECRLVWSGEYVRQAEFEELDGGDDFEGTPSKSKRAEARARRAVVNAGGWRPLAEARGRGPGGQFVPAIPGWVVQQDRAALRAERDRLRAALEPFAELCTSARCEEMGEHEAASFVISAASMLAARAALTSGGAK